jgi:hypothetical protein
MASGHVNRTNTWLHRPACKREENPCQLGAVHTLPRRLLFVRFRGQSDINHDRIAERAVGLLHGCKALFILKPEVTTLAGSRWLLPIRRSAPCGSCASIEPFEYAGSTTALRDRIFAATHRLADLEAFELRMVEVERLVLPGVPMGKAECFRLGPGFERRLALPYRV